MRQPVLSGHGVPTASVFASSDGTPIYIDLDTGLAYFMDDDNLVTPTSFRIETRTSDPVSPTAGQIWLRTDL